jgi:hypothetical protein
MSGVNTTRPSKHLLEKHRIQSEMPGEIEEDSETAQKAPIARSVMQQ